MDSKLTALLEYLDRFHRFYACTVLVVNLKDFLHCTTTKTYNFVPIILRIHPIIPEYSPMLFSTYYSRNYACIIDACLMVG